VIELPEAAVIGRQVTDTLASKRIASAAANTSPHKFAWYTGDPAEYDARLRGKVIGSGKGVGGHIEFDAGDMTLSISAPIRYHALGEKRPKKHQLLLEFEDGTAISSRAQMWGAFLCFPSDEESGSAYRDVATERPSPLTDAFDRAYFETLFDDNTPKLSAKAFLATEQRIPGLGNGVLQDILWTTRIHPKRKMGELSEHDIDAMFRALRDVLSAMTDQGGRDTERDLFGHSGGYRTILSRETVSTPCPTCGTIIRKESYLGSTIYTCAGCQTL
jgi:formamidopyrimidine-DNA glycosylase